MLGHGARFNASQEPALSTPTRIAPTTRHSDSRRWRVATLVTLTFGFSLLVVGLASMSGSGRDALPTPWQTATTPGARALAAGPAAPAAATRPDSDTVVGEAPLRVYTGASITLRTDTNEAYARALLGKLDSFLAQANAELSRLLDVTPKPVGATIVVFATQDRYQHHARKHAPGLVNNGGYYDGGTRTVVTYRFNNSMQLYFHELVHALVAEHFQDHHFSRYTRKNWPIWFDEGMSEFLGSYAVDGDGIRIPAANKGKLAYLSNALQHRAFVPLRTLLSASAASFSGASMNIYYAASWGLVDYLARHAVYRTQLPIFFRRIRAGDDGIAAFSACFGSDIEQIERSWRDHIAEATKPDSRGIWLFGGHSIDDWTAHEGGDWSVQADEIVGRGDRHYNYLIKSEVPQHDFRFELDLMIEKGTAGLILGNNYHGEYPYYYLIDVARDAVMVRRSYTATRIEPVKQAFAEIVHGQWAHLEVTVVDNSLSVSVNGREILSTASDRNSYSLFGLYLYHARARFKNVRLQREALQGPGWAAGQAPVVRPGGAGASAASPRGVAAPLRTLAPVYQAPWW
jgi:hypothetical protein